MPVEFSSNFRCAEIIVKSLKMPAVADHVSSVLCEGCFDVFGVSVLLEIFSKSFCSTFCLKKLPRN